MKSGEVLISIFFLPFFSFGQNSILISHTIPYTHPYRTDPSKSVIESYSILSNDSTKREGAYNLTKQDNSPLVTGTYSNGIKTGVWNYYSYDTGELFEQYNYDTKRDIFYHSVPQAMLVKSKKGFITDSIDSPPHLPGEQGFFFALNVKYPVKAMNAGVSGIVYVTLLLDTTGFFSIDSLGFSPKIIASGYSDLFKKAIEDALIALPQYIPAEDKSKKVIIKFEKLPVKFNLN